MDDPGAERATAAERPRVLVVDDDDGLRRSITDLLVRGNFAAVGAPSADRALDLLAIEDFDVALVDVRMGGMSGLELCRRLHETRPRLPVILVTGFATLDTAVTALRAGAFDLIVKPVDFDQLVIALERAVKQAGPAPDVERLQPSDGAVDRLEDLVGSSDEMQRVFERISRTAASDASTLIMGESGTGKELVARAIHRRSRRGSGPFVAVNCAAMPAPLLESELFGHVRGAFTDATSSRPGLFVEAEGGTLFLDEIGDLPVELQPRLLRVLQERCVRPVGATKESPVDFRVVSATNQDLENAVNSGRFRSDLYFRLQVVEIKMPPLRARGDDVLLLAQRVLDGLAKTSGSRLVRISRSAAQRLLDYPWPGNVRELYNCMERAAALSSAEELVVADLPAVVRDYRPPSADTPYGGLGSLPTLDALERDHIARVLAVVRGNKTAAAQVLGIDRRTLYRKLDRHRGAPASPGERVAGDTAHDSTQPQLPFSGRRNGRGRANGH